MKLKTALFPLLGFIGHSLAFFSHWPILLLLLSSNRIAPKMTITLHTEAMGELNSEEAIALHALMDSLSACGVGSLVDLPQIIVVGEQSAGKSSVLGAISGVKFPVASGVCTRFATEIVLREAAQTRVQVSIKFSAKPNEPKVLERTGFSDDELSDIITEARGYMGIAKDSKEFSKDVLRLEIEGPKMLPLTLVDLPGIFHVNTDGQSTQGKTVVDELIDGYMAQTNSIILAVLEANGQVSRHAALGRVKVHDPKGERTLGVITKPDLASRGCAETHIQLAQNREKSHKLKLGWHVLRNRAEDEQGPDDARDVAEERFFASSVWKDIDIRDRGIVSLRRKLAKTLYEHTRRNLPRVIQDIETNLAQRRNALNGLGLARSSIEEMRSFLFNIVSEFQRLTRDGISGAYGDAFFSHIAEPKNRLRADLKGYYLAFEYSMVSSGHEVSIERPDGDDEETDDAAMVPASVADFLATHPLSPELPTPKKMDRKEMNALLERFAAKNVGREFPGVCNSELVVKLFQWQAQPWENIARAHIRGIVAVAKDFIEALVRKIVGDSDAHSTMEAIMAEFVDPFFEKREARLYHSLSELLWPYKEGYAVPLDEEFRQIVLSWKIERLAKQVQKIPMNELVASSDTNQAESLAANKVYTALAVALSTNSGTFTTDDDIDMMQAYYEVSSVNNPSQRLAIT